MCRWLEENDFVKPLKYAAKMGVDLQDEFKARFGRRLKIDFNNPQKFIVAYRVRPEVVAQILRIDKTINIRFVELVQLDEKLILVVSGS